MEIPKGYIYGPIAFAILVELLNLRYQAVQSRRRARTEEAERAVIEPLHLRPAHVKSDRPGEPLPTDTGPHSGGPPGM